MDVLDAHAFYFLFARYPNDFWYITIIEHDECVLMFIESQTQTKSNHKIKFIYDFKDQFQVLQTGKDWKLIDVSALLVNIWFHNIFAFVVRFLVV